MQLLLAATLHRYTAAFQVRSSFKVTLSVLVHKHVSLLTVTPSILVLMHGLLFPIEPLTPQSKWPLVPAEFQH